MKKLNNVLLPISALAIFFVLGLVSPSAVYAATPPNLGVATGYSVFGNAGVTDAGGSTMWGDVGENGAGDGSTAGAAGTLYTIAQPTVVSAISAAYGDLAGEALTQIPILDLDVPNTVVPGVYDIGVGATFTDTLTLNGAGVYIFRSAGGTVAQTAGGTMVLAGGACASDVYWQIADSMTFAAAGNIEGTIITNTAAITFASGVNLKGRAWAATQVTMNNNQITEPVCAPLPANLTVTKVVINDNGGTKVVADFPLFVGATSVVSGVANSFVAGAYAVTETPDATYTQTFSGDCDASGNINLVSGSNVVCTVTNDDITPPPPSSSGGGSPRPKIHVEKVPTPDELPDGPGIVVYDYTVTNVGSISIENVEVTDDTCADVKFVAGDDDDDERLDRDEEWAYQCTMRLSETTTNVVTATGESQSGRSTKDIDEATVVVTQRTPALPTAPVATVVAAITTPRLPNTGVAPRGNNLPWDVVVPAGVLAMFAFFINRKKQIV